MKFDLQITARIPIVRDKIGGEKAEIEASGTRAGRRAEGWERLVDRLTPISGKRKTKTPQSSLHIAGTLISLPVTIPMLILAGSGATVFSAQAKGHSYNSFNDICIDVFNQIDRDSSFNTKTPSKLLTLLSRSYKN